MKRDVDAEVNLKRKVIEDYKYFIHRLIKGYKEDYQEIMDTICLIDLLDIESDELENVIPYYVSYLSNNGNNFIEFRKQ